MTTPTPLAAYLQQHPQTQYLDAMLCDLSCVMRGKRYPIHLADSLFTNYMMLPGSVFLLSANGDSLDPEGMGFSDGDPDQVAIPIADTLVPVPWAQYPTAQVLLSLQNLDNEPYYFEPRNVLARVLEQFSELKLRPVVAFELEFYLLDRTPDNGKLQPPKSPLSGCRSTATQVYSMDDLEEFSSYLHEVTDACARQGIASGALSAEYAACQFEINLSHRAEPLAAADQCVMFRRVVQGIAKKHAMQATFMAKPYAESCGSGLHLHISLVDHNGNNVFAGTGEYGSQDCTSPTLRHAIGGLQHSVPECMAIFAPNRNSYRRFMPNSYVPVDCSWGFDNRSVAFRIPRSPARARRIEHRIAGADANPYLTLAAVLAGIHYGLVNRLDAEADVVGNVGLELHPQIPFELPEAVQQCQHGKILSSYFGQRYLDAYCSCKAKEYHEFIASKQPDSSCYL